MSAGLFGLLDDVAALAKLAAASLDDIGGAAGKATTKAAGVVVDDTAVTPQYVHGVAAEREIPIVKKIAVGSLRNKLVFILPAALLLSQFASWLLTPLLMIGGCYLVFEGAEKIWERIIGHSESLDPEHPHAAGEHTGREAEKEIVAGAVRTDFILSTEIMVIALDSVADEAFVTRLLILALVAVVITIGVYGAVGLIVKMDDAGLALAERSRGLVAALGRGLVAGMPKLLALLSTVGVAAMLWVGGHILLKGLDELGWHPPYAGVHHLEHAVHGGVLGWVVNTGASALAGLLVGAVIVAVLHLVPRRGDS